MKLLVADIGGTNARFAYQEKNNSDLNNFAYLKCSDYENIYDAIEHYQQKNNLTVENMSIAVASTTKTNDIKFTNNNWKFKQSEFFKYLRLNKLIFVNDFVAQCLSLASFYKDISQNKLLNKKKLNVYNLKTIKRNSN